MQMFWWAGCQLRFGRPRVPGEGDPGQRRLWCSTSIPKKGRPIREAQEVPILKEKECDKFPYGDKVK
eukprot:8074893-Alexandrium_andersonii.AAC.1